MNVFVYIDTNKDVGHPDHIKVFANQDVAESWFILKDPEGVAFEYEVIGATLRRLNFGDGGAS